MAKLINKQFIYILLLMLLMALSSIVLNGIDFKQVLVIGISMFSLLIFIFLLILINSYLPYLVTKILLIALSSAFMLAHFSELVNIYITEMSFYEAFWDLLTTSFILESVKIYPIPAISFTIIFIVSQVLFYKVLSNKEESKTFKKLDNFIKTLLIILTFIFLIISSSLTRMISSFCFYQLSKESRTFEYLVQQPNKDDIYAQVGNNKNVVHIILESYADIFTDDNIYPNLTPNFKKLKQKGIIFENLEQIKYSEYSEAGNFISNRGRMMYLGENKNKNDIGLTYVLNKAGYYNVFMRGASKNAGGFKFTETYSKQQGVDEFWSLETFEEKYDKLEKSSWGVKDSTMFNEALLKYKELSSKKQPFYLGLFTIDTHIDQEMSNACKGAINLMGDGLLNDVACTDYMVNDFIKKLSKLPNFKNTLIVIHADHMPYFADHLLKDQKLKQFGLILNTGKKPFVQEQTAYLFDIPKTIIKNLEIETNAKFLLGEDITTDFIRDKKLKREFINKPIDVDMYDYSDKAAYKVIARIIAFFVNDTYYGLLD